MKYLSLFLLSIALACAAHAQVQTPAPRGASAAVVSSQGISLPVQKLGRDDLIAISVYGEPELSGTVRVESDGTIRLRMVPERIPAAGLLPEQLEDAIENALMGDGVLVKPIVTASVVEYRSRPITVAGAVRNPTTFQAMGTITLLDAITNAGGLAENAGSEIIVSKRLPGGDSTATAAPPIRIQVHALLTAEDRSSNPILDGGETVRVPMAGQVYVVGEVKKPGSFYLTDGTDASVLKALALSGGLDSFPQHTAYIYRTAPGQSGRTEIPIPLKKILKRKAGDVALTANDILYVPDASGRRISTKVLETSLGMSVGIATLLLYASN